jgi:hypothetical protein
MIQAMLDSDFGINVPTIQVYTIEDNFKLNR